MSIFEDIKNGLLPKDESIIQMVKNNIKDFDNKKEIEQYIEILTKHLNSDILMEEKIPLIKILFILEFLIDSNYLENFVDRAFILKLAKKFVTKEYIYFFEKLVSNFDGEKLFIILSQKIEYLDKYPKDDMRSLLNWCFHEVWNIDKFHNTHLFTKFYIPLQHLLAKLIKSYRTDDMMYVEFFTYQIMGNSFQTMDEWREFNKKIITNSIQGYDNIIPQLPKPNPTKKAKKKIAFIKDRIVFNSPYMVEFSLFTYLMENKEFTKNYELVIYSFNQFEKEYDDESCIKDLQELGIKVKRPVDYFAEKGYYNSHFNKALTFRQILIDDEIDIMIAGGGFPILNFLFASRTAPFQIYYSHGNCAYDVPNIDKRISHFEQECKEFEWNLINIPLLQDFLSGLIQHKLEVENLKKTYKNQFGKNLIILGSIGRLVKIDNNKYIKIVSKIMKKNPNTIYLACGDGNKETIKEKLKKYNIDKNRFIFTGHINPHIYGQVIGLYLAPFESAGQALQEYRMKYKTYVALHTKKWAINNKNIDIENMILKKLYTKKQLKKALNKESIIKENSYAFNFRDIANVINKKDYLKVALRFLEDKELANKVIKEYKYVIEKNKPNVEGFLKVIK